MQKKLNLKGVWKLLKQAGIGFDNDKVFKLSGSLAYYTIFSIAPMIIVIIFIADVVWSKEAIEGTIYDQMKGFVGANAAAQIQDIIRNASISGKGNVAAVIGIITLLIGATTVFAEI